MKKKKENLVNIKLQAEKGVNEQIFSETVETIFL